MILDSTGFPMVWMNVGTAGIDTDDEGFKAFEVLVAGGEPFVLLDAERANQAQAAPSQEAQKQLSLWMKRHKAALRSVVKAQVHIEPDLGRRQVASAFAAKFELFWGYPLFVVGSREEGMSLARKLMAQ
ncbi:hypothetical protein N5F23_02225 [Pseudomonas sichuanensis]|uniref:hypothetical protein n=1 Tax=Pseudomonas sichuanensis TaxID=2213015 RepID=UPI00244AEDC6|nr:hypothetical protein [Pseudomonas sichuanensis]MDH0729207.1 hypothetical protein [Pseudomonas sichuanensis]MDH1581409.1 hypothetical protein [Pseudomonas sichuanensis]MDH1593879.1 hypothetical protein [Pseudomonas sichuanensis]MDH1600011.1 hypothetical protein [Pseudomonas sichuanensis]